MKKIYRLDEIDCVSCAAKLERAVGKIDGVKQAEVNFMAQKMTLEIDDSRAEAVLAEVKKVCAKLEPDCALIG